MANVVVANSSANLSGDTLMTAENAETVTGLKTFDLDPAAPFAVTSGSAKVTNLDADLLDGFHASDLTGANAAGTVSVTGVWTFSTNPVFNALGIPETAIADGSVFPRIAGTETITGQWTFNLPPIIKAGSASLTGKTGGVIYSSTTSTGNVGAGEDTLYTQAIAASVLATNGDVLIIEVYGTGAANANSKILRFKWDGSAFYTSPTDTTTGDNWSARIVIARRGATSQAIGGTFCGWGASEEAEAFFSTGSATLSGAITFLITGEGVSNGDITVEMVRIYWEPVA